MVLGQTLTSPLQKAKGIYPNSEKSFWGQVRSYLEFGVVVSEGDSFIIMGSYVDKSAPKSEWLINGKPGSTDAVYVQVFAGDLKAAVNRLASYLDGVKWIGFSRWKEGGNQSEVRWYNLDSFRRRINSHGRI